MRKAINKSKDGYTEEDKREKTGTKTYSDVVIESVKNQIKKIPVNENYNVREKSASIFNI